jgi:hypothetical protein
MLKMRRYLFIIPFFSLPVMCTFETGTILYFCVSSFLNFLINYALLSERSKKFLGVVEFLPGSKLERMNQFRMVNEKYQENNEITKYLSGENESDKELKSQEEKKSQMQQQTAAKNVQDTNANRRRKK